MIRFINDKIRKLDNAPLWILGIPFLILLFVPYMAMGKGSVFEITDQLDETLFTYVVTAKHLFQGADLYPEMMGGIAPSGMLPAAVLFVPLYRVLPVFAAFVVQYFCVCATAFGGMYLLVKKATGSSGLAFVLGALFCMLPYQPVYGLNIVGAPLCIFCFWQLKEGKHIVWSLLGTAYFGLTTHLVLLGYVALTYLGIWAVWLLIRHRGLQKKDRWFYLGCVLLGLIYCAVNYEMFLQLIVGTGGFVSHREELVNNTENINVWENIRGVFLAGGQHASTGQYYMMLPMAVVTLVQGIRYRRLTERGKHMWKALAGLWAAAALTALLCGFLTSETVMTWRNAQTGFFRYFQANRYYWACPTIWWLAFALSAALVWTEFPRVWEWVRLAVLFAVILPTALLVKNGSNLYDNVNQYHHGSAFTGKITWEEYYMEDVLALVDAHIGRDKSTYRVASLGRSPAPSLMYGFYTIDGYSNNYSLDYKHAFREIIEKELDKNGDTKTYFDTWGSRCYLFSAEYDRAHEIRKDEKSVYRDLELNTEKMRELGCEYILAAGEIVHPEKLGLILEGRFDTEESVYEVWLYRLGEK